MQIIFALIIAYLVFVTPTWAVTRLVVLVDVGIAMLYELTPLRAHFGIVEPIALSATLILWAVNLFIERRAPVDSPLANPSRSSRVPRAGPPQ